ncbi:MAG: hypothetical protein ACSLE9_00910 [Burkholderiaceae bacterium]
MRAALLLQPSPLLPLRACDLCDHGITVGGVRYCVCSDVVLPEQLPRGVPVRVVRDSTGPCGWEARHMSAPFLRAA